MEIDNLKYNSENIKYKRKHSINLFTFITLLFFIIIIFLILKIIFFNSILIKFISNYKDIKNFIENNLKINYVNNNESNINFDKNNFVLKTKYDNDMRFYQELLKLYIENNTEFKIRGRQRIMEIFGKTYNDSNISTIQDKLNWALIHENPEYKSKIADKILLHDYSKKILGKDICVTILKVYNSSKEITISTKLMGE